MTPDGRIDRIEDLFMELSLKLDQLLEGHTRILNMFARDTTSDEKAVGKLPSK